MATHAVSLETEPLSQVERVADTFFAPSRTFLDIRRSASWWLPYVLLVLATWALGAGIAQKVGWSQLAENEIRFNPKAQAKLADMSPEQVAMQHKGTQVAIQGVMYGAPVTNLVFAALYAIILWPTMNFVFGGSGTFGRVFAVCMYAFLPTIFKSLLSVLLLYAGRAPDTFTMESMLGSSAGYYITEPGALKTCLESFDLFTLWTLVLLSIGLPIVAKTKSSSGYIAVFGWFILIVLVRTGFAAI